jgi:hypothetical protein
VADLASALEAHLARMLDGILDDLTAHNVARTAPNVCAALTDLGLTDATVRTILAMLERRLAREGVAS